MRSLFAITVCALVGLLTVGTALVLPLSLGPDEPGHLQYAGWLMEHGLPEPGQSPVLEAQHPPLYHLFLGGLYKLARKAEAGISTKAPGPAWILPYERRVILQPLAKVVDSVALSVKEAEGQEALAAFHAHPSFFRGATPYLLRLSGLLLALIVAWVVLTTAERVLPHERRLVLLTAGLGLLVPQFSAIFATPNNDQFALLFGTLGFALVVREVAGERRERRGRWLLASLIFGLGFLSKLTVLGPFIAAALLVAGAGGNSKKKRLSSLLWLAAGPLLLAGWWAVWALPHLIEGVYRFNAYILRPVSPDFLGYLNILGQLVPSFLASVGRHGLNPGLLWMVAASMVPLLAVAAPLLTCLKRQVKREERWICLGFLGGLAALILALLLGNRAFAYVQGRYLHPMLLPGALALAVGFSHLFGRRAKLLAASLLVVVAAGGPLLLHGQLLPAYHAGHRIQRIPYLEQYVDLGVDPPDPRIGKALVGREDSWGYPRPAGRWCFSQSKQAPVLVHFRHLASRGLYLLSPHLHPDARVVEPAGMISLDLQADGAQICGFLSPRSRQPWPSFPVPRSATRDGSFTLVVRPQAWQGAGVSELVLRRLPLTFEGSIEKGEELQVRFTGQPSNNLPPLQVQLRSQGLARGPARPLQADGHGGFLARLPLPPRGTGALELLLRLPESLFADTELVPFRTGGRIRVRGDKRAPGAFVLDLDPEQDRGHVVASVPAVVFPENRYRFILRDARGRDISKLFQLNLDQEPPLGPGKLLLLQENPAPATRLLIRFMGEGATTLSRLEARSSLFFVFDLKLRR